MTKKKFFEKLNNEEILPEDIFTDNFMKKYTSFSCLSAFEEEVQERGEKTRGNCSDDKLLQVIIEEKTSFKNFEKMKEMAYDEYCRLH